MGKKWEKHGEKHGKKMGKKWEKNGKKVGKMFFPFFSGKCTQKSFIPDVTDGPVTHFFAKLDDTPGENPLFDSGRSTGQHTHYASGFDIGTTRNGLTGTVRERGRPRFLFVGSGLDSGPC